MRGLGWAGRRDKMVPVHAAPGPSTPEFLQWRQLLIALRRAAEYQPATPDERARIIRAHAADGLFADFWPGEPERRRGQQIQRRLVASVRQFRPPRRSLHVRDYEGQAILCWYLRVAEGQPSDRGVAEAVGRTTTYLTAPWGDTPMARQKTVRARMWTDESARTTATRGAWPGIRRLVAEVEERLGPMLVADGLGGETPVTVRNDPRAPGEVDSVTDVVAGIRRLDGRHRAAQQDIRYLKWRHSNVIDRLGNSSTLVKMKVMGKDQRPVTCLYFPVYYDGEARPFADYKIGRSQRWQSVAAEWVPDLGGRFAIPIPPLANGATLSLQYRYRLPDVYQEDDEWFEWFFAAEHKDYRLDITFAPEWELSDVRVSCPESTTRPLPEPVVKDNTITWSIEYPEVPRRYRFDWKMVRVDHAGRGAAQLG